MNNILAHTELPVDIISKVSYPNLIKCIIVLDDAIKELEEMKKMAVFYNDDVKAVEYQKYIHNLMANRKSMFLAMKDKEAIVNQDTLVGPICLN